jgi:hypothetical protein
VIGNWPFDPRALIGPVPPKLPPPTQAARGDLSGLGDDDLLLLHRRALVWACTVGGSGAYSAHRALAILALEILDRGLQTMHLTWAVRAHVQSGRSPWLN